MKLTRSNWIRVAGLVIAASCLTATLPISSRLRTTMGDVIPFLLILLAVWVMGGNAVHAQGRVRLFWTALTVGCILWSANLAMWVYYEVILQKPVADPYIGDVILFLHLVPFIAAVGLLAHQSQDERKPYFSTINFLILLVWWVFLYSFMVLPDQYVVLRRSVYNQSYDLLYLIENGVLVLALGFVVSQTKGSWRAIYWNLFVAAAVYTWSSTQINVAIGKHQYRTGGFYDIAFVGSICWFIFTGVLGRGASFQHEPEAPPKRPGWLILTPRLSMAAILSLPLIGGWEIFFDTAPSKSRSFRLFATLTAMLVLGTFVFVRQILMDRELVRVLHESRVRLENLQKLQTELVQREKLASLGQVVAGAAHEINNPLTAILGYSDLLVQDERLPGEQVAMAKKIGQQARRTRDLVSGLLNFAQHSPAEKNLVDLGVLLKRAAQIEASRCSERNIHIETDIAPALPRIYGSPNQLFQCCSAIILNAIDAMEEVGGGTLSIRAHRQVNEVVVEFSDSGPGIRDPQRVFDPFYTTKPVGKGKGLGLSATYGVIQEHQGQISCFNRPQGGAVFVVSFPVTAEADLLEGPIARSAVPEA